MGKSWVVATFLHQNPFLPYIFDKYDIIDSGLVLWYILFNSLEMSTYPPHEEFS